MHAFREVCCTIYLHMGSWKEVLGLPSLKVRYYPSSMYVFSLVIHWILQCICLNLHAANVSLNLGFLKHMVAKYCLHVHYFIVLSGIGQGRLTNNLNGAPIDYAMMVSDDESVSMVCCN